MTAPAERANGKGRTSVLVVGVGGQGVLTAAQVLGEAAHAAGLRTLVAQLHGMSQRGGTVECTVLLGPGESSSFAGAADVLLALEPLEALRAVGRVGPETRVLAATTRILPWEVARSGGGYPSLETIEARLRAATPRVTLVDAGALAHQAGAVRAVNVVMLGALSAAGELPFDADVLRDAALRRCGKAFGDLNRRAFELGRTHGSA